MRKLICVMYVRCIEFDQDGHSAPTDFAMTAARIDFHSARDWFGELQLNCSACLLSVKPGKTNTNHEYEWHPSQIAARSRRQRCPPKELGKFPRLLNNAVKTRDTFRCEKPGMG